VKAVAAVMTAGVLAACLVRHLDIDYIVVGIYQPILLIAYIEFNCDILANQFTFKSI